MELAGTDRSEKLSKSQEHAEIYSPQNEAGSRNSNRGFLT